MSLAEIAASNLTSSHINSVGGDRFFTKLELQEKITIASVIVIIIRKTDATTGLIPFFMLA